MNKYSAQREIEKYIYIFNRKQQQQQQKTKK